MLIFHDVTFSTYDSLVDLQSLGSLSSGGISFAFKTFDESGVLAFSTDSIINGRNPIRNIFVAELFSGHLLVKVRIYYF